MSIVLLPSFSLAIGFAFLLTAGCLEYMAHRIPNRMVGGFLVLAFAYVGMANWCVPDHPASFGTAFFGMVLAGGMLLPAYQRLGLGAGCVKAQAVFGAWVGAGMSYRACATTLVVSTLLAAAVLFVAFVEGRYRRQQAIRRQESVVDVIYAQLPLSLGTTIGVMLLNWWM